MYGRPYPSYSDQDLRLWVANRPEAPRAGPEMPLSNPENPVFCVCVCEQRLSPSLVFLREFKILFLDFFRV